jgi:hypothetical protein
VDRSVHNKTICIRPAPYAVNAIGSDKELIIAFNPRVSEEIMCGEGS